MKITLLSLFLVATNILLAQNTFPATGNVGIGITTPAYNLDISSAANTTLRIGSTTANTGYSDLIFKGSLNSWKISKYPSGTNPTSTHGTLAITYNNGAFGGDRPMMTFFYQYGSNPRAFIGTTDVDLFHGVMLGVDGEIGARKMIITSNNDITNWGSNYKLIVDGKIGSREVVVSLATPFPDYVFKPTHKLLSLSEIEQYIKQYSRLPEMPSAEQVEKDGLEIAKTTSLLVQKIEELTLHMIEMNKKLETLEAENKELKKKTSHELSKNIK